MAFWFLCKASDSFLIPFQVIGWLSDYFFRHWMAFLFLCKALDGFLISFQGIRSLSDSFWRKIKSLHEKCLV
jgi:hypothetical protein